MAITPDDPLTNGPSGYYDPAFGLMAVQQPEMLIRHLAMNGVPVPDDMPEGFSPQDAHESLGKSLSAASSQNPSGPNMIPSARIGEAFRGLGYADEGGGSVPPDALPGGVQTPIGPPIVANPPVPTPSPRPTNAPTFTQPTDMPSLSNTTPASAGGGEVTDGASASEDTPTPRPRPKSADTEKDKGGGGGDSLGKALAGLVAMKTPPVQQIHSPPPPHPSNQLFRSNVPQLLMQEIAATGKPGAALRLGEALRRG